MGTFPNDPWSGFRKPGFPVAPGTSQLGPRQVSTTTPDASLAGGGMTLEALMARQKQLAGQQPQLTSMQSPMQGVAYALEKGLAGFEEGRASKDVATGQHAVANALTTMGEHGELTPEGKAALAQYDPDTFLALWKSQQKQYGPVITGEGAKALGLDPTKQYQLNLGTGQYDPIGGAGSSITINPPSAETSAKIGLSEGFTDNFDAILKSVDAGELTGLNWVPSVGFGRGNGGTQYRNIRQGTEGLIRLLTGAGMNEGEARDRVTSYEPSITDDAPTLRNKIVQLKQAIDNVTQAVQTRGNKAAASDPDLGKPGHGSPAAPDTGGGDPNKPPASGGGDPEIPALTGKDWGSDPTKVDMKALKPGDIFNGTVFLGGDPTDNKSWAVPPKKAPAAPAAPAASGAPAAPSGGGLY